MYQTSSYCGSMRIINSRSKRLDIIKTNHVENIRLMNPKMYCCLNISICLTIIGTNVNTSFTHEDFNL